MAMQKVRIEWTIEPTTHNTALYVGEQTHFGADIYRLGAHGPESPTWEDTPEVNERLMEYIHNAYIHDASIAPPEAAVERLLTVSIHSAEAVNGFYPLIKRIVRTLSATEWNKKSRIS